MTRALLITAAALALLVGAGLGSVARGASAQERGEQTRVWLERTLHVPIPPRTVVVGGLAANNVGQAEEDGTIRLAADYAGDNPESLRVRIHEYLHRPANVACWGWVEEDGSRSPERAIEEGIADALTIDLLPAARKQLLRARVYLFELTSPYTREVVAIRYASMAATGRPWNSREARLWRRVLWQQDCAGRVATLAGVGR